MAAGDESAGEIRKVVDFTIENDDDGAVLVEHRLLSAAEVDDAQPAMSKADVVLNEVSAIVRTTMRLGGSHPLHQEVVYRLSCVEIDDPANSAHTLSLRALLFR